MWPLFVHRGDIWELIRAIEMNSYPAGGGVEVHEDLVRKDAGHAATIVADLDADVARAFYD